MPDHVVYGVVYAPLQVDTDWETMTAHDVAKMAHDFMADGRVTNIDIMHDRVKSGASVIESFVARKGDPDYPEGAWVLGVRVPEGELWDAIKTGELNGFSVDMNVLKLPKTVMVDIARIALGNTEPSLATDAVEAHQHEYYIEFDSEGQVVLGITNTMLDHCHAISGTTATDKEMEHAHRFFIE